MSTEQTAAMLELYRAMYHWRGEQLAAYEQVIHCLCDGDPDGARRALLPLLPKDDAASLTVGVRRG